MSTAPSELRLRRAERVLEVSWADGTHYSLPLEYLRTHSPSAEVQGHGPGQQILVAGKRAVGVSAIEPVGQYGVLLRFDDGHDTGIFSWDTLARLGRDYAGNWQAYVAALEKAGLGRD
ncbi:MAG: gamma-butyrobetaine hydroxylase family protein [Metallibacterium scheffleri]